MVNDAMGENGGMAETGTGIKEYTHHHEKKLIKLNI